MWNRNVLVFAVIFGFSEILLAEGDPVVGEKKAETCMGCHAVAGYFNVYPSYKVPKLGGQNAGYVVSALKAYKAGTRRHGTMQANAYNLSEQDMLDIASYLSSVD